MKNLVIGAVSLLALTIANACGWNTEQKTGFLIPALSVMAQGDITVDIADSKCQQYAGKHDEIPPGEYLAWLSTSSESAADRIFSQAANDGVPIKNVAGDVIAANKRQLLDGNIGNLFLDYDGTSPDTQEESYVWTGTKTDGTLGTSNCEDWTSAKEIFGVAGVAIWHTNTWTDFNQLYCYESFGLYCISADTYTPRDTL